MFYGRDDGFAAGAVGRGGLGIKALDDGGVKRLGRRAEVLFPQRAKTCLFRRMMENRDKKIQTLLPR